VMAAAFEPATETGRAIHGPAAGNSRTNIENASKTVLSIKTLESEVVNNLRWLGDLDSNQD
jgi:hypothetical protein